MILSDKTLLKLIAEKELSVSPLSERNIQPASIDCTLGRHFLKAKDTHKILTLDEEIHYDEIESDEIIIPPHTFLLATTLEYIKLPPYLVAFVEGRSSVGRMGLFIQNAGWVDAGFEGCITLELYNANNVPLKIDAGRRICQLVFCKMDQAATRPYQGKYQGQTKAVGSQIYKDLEKQHP